jgi:hypothetical protein
MLVKKLKRVPWLGQRGRSIGTLGTGRAMLTDDAGARRLAVVAILLGALLALARVSAAQADPGRPAVPAEPNLPADSTFTVEKPGRPRSELLYHRNIVGIIFDDTTSGPTIRALFGRYGATIIGGVPSVAEYIVRIPDPGPSFASLDSVVTRIYSEPGVDLASKVYYRTPFSLRGRQGLPGDTTRPPVPLRLNLPADSTFTVEKPGRPRSELLYHRNIVGIIFDDTTGGAEIRDLLQRYGGRIIGGMPGDREYIVQIPDPGATHAALESIVKQLNAEPGVALASMVYYRTPIHMVR